MAQTPNCPIDLPPDSTSTDDVNYTKELHNLLKNNDLMAVNYLISSYNKEFSGVILNEEKDMNICLQICAFLAALPSSVLIITDSSSFVPWHYYLEKFARFTVERLTQRSTSHTIQELKDKYSRAAFLIEETNVMHVKDIESIEFSIAIAENIELVACKSVLKRKIKAKYHIGTTFINFYENWDPKQIHSMLEWASHDASVQFKTFLELDDTNFEKFLNNYRFWWYRLTWNYCDSFVKPKAGELRKLRKKMDAYKRVLIGRYTEQSEVPVSPQKVDRKRRQDKEGDVQAEARSEETENACASTSGASGVQVPKKDEYVDVRMDELSIVSSIIRKLEASPEPAKKIIKSPTSASDNNSLLRSFLNATPGSSSSAVVSSPPKKDNLSDLIDEADSLLEDVD